METKTEQHHENLTEEEKKISAQIRSVATTLYERVDLDKPTVEFLHEHFYMDPTLALAYFYCCSTDPWLAIFNDELQPDIDESVIWNHISNLITSPNKLYKPITKDIVDGVTHELTLQDVENDPNWITKSHALLQAMLTGPSSMLKRQRHLGNKITYPFCDGDAN